MLHSWGRRWERTISTIGWVAIAVAAWVVASAAVAVLVGRVIARRDWQVPAQAAAAEVPAQRARPPVLDSERPVASRPE